jgi:hypothetical protein
MAHDRVRRSTDLPVFYGNPAKDVIISPRHLIKRFENAAEIARWDTDEKKCNEFYMILRDDAITWWETLEDYNIDTKVWNDVKAQFIRKFEPKATAKTSCANLVELSQRQGESTNQFYFRLFRIYKRLCETKPVNMSNVRLVPANPAAATAAELQKIKEEGIADMEMFLKHQLFLAGTREPMRTELMKAGKDTLAESVDYAVELENIYRKDHRTISAIIEETDTDVIDGLDPNELNDDELEAINAIRKRFGKKPFFKRGGSHNGNNRQSNNGGSSNGSIKCRYCQKMGHIQKVCRSRLRDKAPMVDANGKPFTRRVNAVEDQDEDVAISTVSGPGLNWK